MRCSKTLVLLLVMVGSSANAQGSGATDNELYAAFCKGAMSALDQGIPAVRQMEQRFAAYPWVTGAMTNPGSPSAAVELAVEIMTGPELVAGSTRMMAGTTQKIALDALNTAVMIALGKTYGARMVDLRATNAKLRHRALRIVQEITGVTADDAGAALAASGFSIKPALVALMAGVDPQTAERVLNESSGRVRDAIAQQGK